MKTTNFEFVCGNCSKKVITQVPSYKWIYKKISNYVKYQFCNKKCFDAFTNEITNSKVKKEYIKCANCLKLLPYELEKYDKIIGRNKENIKEYIGYYYSCPHCSYKFAFTSKNVHLYNENGLLVKGDEDEEEEE